MYDSSKDKIIKEQLIYNGEYKVQLCQYDDGPEKIAIVREMFLKDGTQAYTNKLGRIDVEVAQLIANGILDITSK
jgi:hypothetical protein